MENLMKKYIFDIIISLIIIFGVVIAGNYIAVQTVNNNHFFIDNIIEMKSEDNIFDKIMLFFDKDSIPVLRKYLESVLDSIVKFDKVPSFDNVKNFFELVISILQYDANVCNFEISNNQVKLICEFNERSQIKSFIDDIKNIEYVDNVFYYEYKINNSKYKIKIVCVHNEEHTI